MRKQEPLLQRHVDLLIENLRRESVVEAEVGSRAARPLRLQSWYNYTTFDILGDLVFGESFHCLENPEHRPWIAAVIGSVRNRGVSVGLSAAGFDRLVEWVYNLGGLPSRTSRPLS